MAFRPANETGEMEEVIISFSMDFFSHRLILFLKTAFDQYFDLGADRNMTNWHLFYDGAVFVLNFGIFKLFVWQNEQDEDS